METKKMKVSSLDVVATVVHNTRDLIAFVRMYQHKDQRMVLRKSKGLTNNQLKEKVEKAEDAILDQAGEYAAMREWFRFHPFQKRRLDKFLKKLDKEVLSKIPKEEQIDTKTNNE